MLTLGPGWQVLDCVILIKHSINLKHGTLLAE